MATSAATAINHGRTQALEEGAKVLSTYECVLIFGKMSSIFETFRKILGS